MKAFIKAGVCLTIILSIAFNVEAQNVKQDKAGNYYAVGRDSVATGKTYTDRSGNIWPVYVSDDNKVFAAVTSKKGRYTRKQLKVK